MSPETVSLFDDVQHPVPAVAQRLRDAGIAAAEVAEDDWWKATAMQRIRYLAASGREFSTNDIRELVPDSIRPRALAGRLTAAAKEGLIEVVGATRSDKPSSHGAWISTWRGTAKAREAESCG